MIVPKPRTKKWYSKVIKPHEDFPKYYKVSTVLSHPLGHLHLMWLQDTLFGSRYPDVQGDKELPNMTQGVHVDGVEAQSSLQHSQAMSSGCYNAEWGSLFCYWVRNPLCSTVSWHLSCRGVGMDKDNPLVLSVVLDGVILFSLTKHSKKSLCFVFTAQRWKTEAWRTDMICLGCLW